MLLLPICSDTHLILTARNLLLLVISDTFRLSWRSLIFTGVATDFVAPMGGGFRIEFDGGQWEFVSADMGVLATAETEEEVRASALDSMMGMDRDTIFYSIEDGMLDDQGLESLKEAVNRAIDDCIKDVVDTAEVV